MLCDEKMINGLALLVGYTRGLAMMFLTLFEIRVCDERERALKKAESPHRSFGSLRVRVCV